MNHGHVTPNPDGSKARCGGPGICAQCSREAAMTAPTPTEQATLDRIEAAPAAEESLRERVAEAIHGHSGQIDDRDSDGYWFVCNCGWATRINTAGGKLTGARKLLQRHVADAAIAVMRGQA